MFENFFRGREAVQPEYIVPGKISNKEIYLGLEEIKEIASRFYKSDQELEEIKDFYGVKLEEDKNNFSIMFERFGDHLLIKSERHGNKEVVTLNLMNCSKINFKSGRDTKFFDSEIRAQFKDIFAQQGSSILPLKKGVEYDFYCKNYVCNFQYIKNNFYHKSHIITDTSNERDFSYGRYQRFSIGAKVKTVAGPYDDTISFKGLETRLEIPHGLGETVYRNLLTEIGNGSTNTVINITTTAKEI